MTRWERVAAAVGGFRLRGVLPLVLMSTLILALGTYAALREDAFLTELNLNNLLLATMPLALVSLGQTCALLVGGFDVSVAALMTMCIVTASYTMTPATSSLGLVPGALALVGVGLATGVFNAILIRVLRLPSIIATLATLSILQGASLWLRSFPSGPISTNAIDALTTSWGLVPLAFIGVVVLAVAGDAWLYRTRAGMAFRAVGLDEASSRRIGIPTDVVVILAFISCSALASIASFYSAAHFQIGTPVVGNEALVSIAAAVLGGASLAGGRGSFVGTLLAALFLTLIQNVLALTDQPTEYGLMTIGALTLLALVVYQGPELVAQLRSTGLSLGRRVRVQPQAEAVTGGD